MKYMTKLLALLLTCILLPLSAQADYHHPSDEASWNKLAKRVTSAAHTLYRLQLQFDENDECIGHEWIAIGTLPAGKRISFTGENDGKMDISYWTGSGIGSAYMDDDNGWYWDVIVIYTESGRNYGIPRPAYGDEEAVRYILKWYYTPEEVDAFIEGMRQGLTGGRDENGQFVIVKMEPLTPPVITLSLAGDNAPEVAMVLPGQAQSTVRLEDEALTVPTADLTWDAEGAEHPFAVIYAPKSGLASLYARDEGKGGVIRKLKAGSVVMVMGESGKYTKVYGEETVGYVITSALAFCDVVEEAQPAAVTRKTHLRLVNRDNGRKILELPEGAQVLVLEEKDKWARVEYQGFAGYVEKRLLDK